MLFAEAAEGGEGTVNNTQNWLVMLAQFAPIILIVVAFWFFLIRPQKKQEKETQKMRNSIGVGDTITTIGGITGTVRQIKDDDDIYIIECGADKSKIAVKKWAVQSRDSEGPSANQNKDSLNEAPKELDKAKNGSDDGKEDKKESKKKDK